MTAPRKLFIAGATGETGKRVLPMAVQAGLDAIAHVQPFFSLPGGAARE